jgi:hypothetical protein
LIGRDGRLYEVQDAVDRLQGVVQVGLVVEPIVSSERFADLERVETTCQRRRRVRTLYSSSKTAHELTWQRMQPNDDMHAIRADGVVGDLAQILLLIATIQVGSRDFHPGRVGHRDPKCVDVDRRKLVDRGVGDIGSVVLLENLAASLLSHGLTERPLVGHICTAIDPDVRRVSGFNFEPGACQCRITCDEFVMPSHATGCMAYQGLSRKPCRCSNLQIRRSSFEDRRLTGARRGGNRR